MDQAEGLSSPEEALLRLEERVAMIEGLVMGSKANCDDENSLVDPLLEIITKLRSLTASRDNYNQLAKQYEEYGDFIDKLDQFEGNVEPDAVKWEHILAQEDKLRDKATLIESIVSKKDVVDSNALKDIDPLLPKLEKIRELLIRQDEQASKLSEETQDLIRNYHQLMFRLKNKMITWEKMLAAIEISEKSSKKEPSMIDFD
ncbi:uncharacterized protein LOC107362852 [Tetranychus urticae]|uniref:Dynactin subunit 3 n=1 Tax=Tetranychus urticae TaxID=32264 RepID=T1KDK5_TETUR|nr:uncharacterized protein LOC107362852 [Tetranychus urticae]